MGLVDGGVWANNPIAIAVVEAVTLLGWAPQSLHVLSLGCLDEVYTLPRAGGWGTFNTKLIKLLMDGQALGAMGMAKLLTGDEHEREAIHRIDHAVRCGAYGLAKHWGSRHRQRDLMLVLHRPIETAANSR